MKRRQKKRIGPYFYGTLFYLRDKEGLDFEDITYYLEREYKQGADVNEVQEQYTKLKKNGWEFDPKTHKVRLSETLKRREKRKDERKTAKLPVKV